MTLRDTRFLVSMIVLCLLAAPAFSQTTTAGSVAGQVVDEQNAAVPGAQIRLVDPNTGSTLNTMSNDQGRYLFSTVPPGNYNVTVTKQGFSTFSMKGQNVDVAAVLPSMPSSRSVPRRRSSKSRRPPPRNCRP